MRETTQKVDRLIAHYERAQALSNTGSWEWDIPTDALRWTREIYRIFGLDPEGFAPSYPAFLDRIHPDDRSLVERSVARAIEGAQDYDVQHRVVRPDGEIRIVRERGVVERAADGRALRMVGAVQDVTALHKAETVASDLQRILSNMVGASPEAIIVTDRESRVMMFSAGAERIFGYSSDEMIGRKIHRLIPPRFRAAHRSHIEDFQSAGNTAVRMHERPQLAGLRKSGEEFPAEASVVRTEGAQGVLLTAIVRDLSAQHAHEAALVSARENAERASEIKSSLLANMSHEIRTPLNGMLGVASVLQRTNLTREQREMVDLVITSGQSLRALLEDILDLAKLEAGKMAIVKEPVALRQVASDLIGLFGATAAEKKIAIRLDWQTDWDGQALGDALRIRQVLSNLLSNAVKFTAAGEVVLRVTAIAEDGDDRRVVFEVQDTGVGFSPEAAARLFERFEQEDVSMTRRFGGTGLGLSISKALVELIGGAISASGEPGVGAVFRVELPMRRIAAGPVANGDDDAEIRGDLERVRVLLAEDHPVNRKVIALMLDGTPAELSMVENGAEAVAEIMANPYDIILMDMQMPVMDGLEAIREIRAWELRSGRAPVRICVLTANASSEHREMARAAGADGFLVKPVEIDQLYAAVFGIDAGDGMAT